MFATVRLSDPHAAGSSEAAPERPVVPEGAVQRDGEEFLAFVALGPNRFEVRELQIGRRAGGEVEVLAGLEEGERVVVEGAFLLKSEASKDSLGEGHEH
jgi:cobalt-zinc-cadmium efflux system membrane fusion protein